MNWVQWTEFFQLKVRPVVVPMVPFVALGWVSTSLLLLGEDDFFARFGSAIVVWAILSLSVQREKYSKSTENWDRVRVIKHLNQMRELEELREQSITLTFDLHACQIAQISYEIGGDNPFVGSDPNDIGEFCLDVQRRLENGDITERSKELIENLRLLESQYHREVSHIGGWSTLVWKLEIMMLCWGTIQWGYGDCFVRWFHGTMAYCG